MSPYYIYNKENIDELAQAFDITGKIQLEGTLQIHSTAIIHVTNTFAISGNGIIRDNARIEGNTIRAENNFYLDHHAEIGGGSAFCNKSYFICGKDFHLGSYAHINTARGVTIGNTVGMGRFSAIYTHGAYLDATQGFPEQWGAVTIGNNVWMPHGVIVMAGITIGDNTVIAAKSLVNKDIIGGGLWAGIPAKQIDDVIYPNPMTSIERIKYIENICKNIETTEQNELRRHGIR